jgi:repressor LexA
MLTPRQRAAYDFITEFLERRGFAPSFEEIRQHLGLASLNAVAKLVAQLRRRGALAPVPSNAKRALRPSRGLGLPPRRPGPLRGTAGDAPFTVPLLGVVAAGAPIEPVENPEPVEVPAALGGGPGERYALRVRGDSMIDEQIRDGDLVIVEEREEARSGETVIALVDGDSVTVKRFRRDGAQVTLEPANPAMAPLVLPAERVRIQGVVIGVLRRL